GRWQGDPKQLSLGDPTSALASYRLAAALLERQNKGDAELRRGLAEVYRAIGDVEADVGEAHDALDAYEKAWQYQNSLELGAVLADSLISAGRFSTAADRARSALGAVADDASSRVPMNEVRLALARALDRTGEAVEAQAFLNQARQQIQA